MCKYFVVKLSKKDNKEKIILQEYININQDVLNVIESLKNYNISKIKHVDYLVGEFIKSGTIINVSKHDNNIHVIVLKNEQEQEIILNVDDVKKKYKYDIQITGKIIDIIKSDKLTKDLYSSTDKEVKHLKLDESTLLIKKYSKSL